MQRPNQDTLGLWKKSIPKDTGIHSERHGGGVIFENASSILIDDVKKVEFYTKTRHCNQFSKQVLCMYLLTHPSRQCTTKLSENYIQVFKCSNHLLMHCLWQWMERGKRIKPHLTSPKSPQNHGWPMPHDSGESCSIVLACFNKFFQNPAQPPWETMQEPCTPSAMLINKLTCRPWWCMPLGGRGQRISVNSRPARAKQ